MNARLTDSDSTSGRRLRAPVKALLLVLAFGSAAALRAQSAAEPHTGTYSLFYSFQCGPDGQYPESGLIRDSSGNLFGTTYSGGQYGFGTVFTLTSEGTERVLHSFGGQPDGQDPQLGSLTLDVAGNLYGTTYSGGLYGGGTVFKVTPTGSESILYNFCRQSGCIDGAAPEGGVVFDAAGDLYGTASEGGAYGDGVVFKLTSGHTETVLHNFQSSSTDGGFPTSNLTQDSSGNLYGTTYTGGAYGLGTVFEISASGVESLLYSFQGYPTDGAEPYGGGLTRDSSDKLYGVTFQGGVANSGVVFSLTPAGTESVLLNFSGVRGENPVDGLAIDAAGDLFGTATGAGSGTGCAHPGCGELFKVTPAGRRIVLHGFTLDSSDGAKPWGGVIGDPSVNLYGTLYAGGAYGCGAVFKYTP